jgi:CheY-like chemotaxis protein
MSDGVSPFDGLTILVAEDDPLCRAVLTKSLTLTGASVTAVADGKGAVAAWEEGAFDLLLFDMEMPLLTGAEAIRRIRLAEADGSRTPALLVTAHTGVDIIEQALDAGADDYLAKPVDLTALAAKLTDLTLMATLPPSSPPETDLPLDEATPVYDPSAWQGRFGADDIREMTAVFLATSADQLAAVVGAVDAGAPEPLRKAAHTLKGAAAQYGALRLSAAARRMERLAEEGNLVEAERLAPLLRAERERLVETLADAVS